MKYTPEDLISCFLLDSMTPEQAKAFSEWIKKNPDNRRLVIRSSLLHRAIHEFFCSRDIASNIFLKEDMNGTSETGLNPAFEEELWMQLSQEEQNAPTIEIPKDQMPRDKQLKNPKIMPARHVSPKGNLWFSIVSIAATLLLFIYVYMHPRHIPQDVATVLDTYQVQWDSPEKSLQKGSRLFNNRKPIHLFQGVLKVQFDIGAQVVIEGPAEFSIDEYERIRLIRGKLYANVPKQAVGFRVNTPDCDVIDLGTEFGINVTEKGETNVHMFKGKASLVTTFQGQPQQSQILQQNQAKKVTRSGNIDSISFQEQDFIRDFDSTHAVLWNGGNLSLTSIVSGGNGFNGFIENTGIDLKTGKLVSGNDEIRTQETVDGYTTVSMNPYVDGVFVPDGSLGAIQLTSAGHAYERFPDTGGDYYMAVGVYSNIFMYTKTGRQYISIHLDEYPKQNSVNLCVHANSGITFDLQKIRESIPFARITHFSSVYGVPKTREDQDNVTSDFYVFVDGVPRMIQQGVSNQKAPEYVKIPLEQTDRFLTLACTEGDMNFGDWSLFVNPVLELELTD